LPSRATIQFGLGGSTRHLHLLFASSECTGVSQFRRAGGFWE